MGAIPLEQMSSDMARRLWTLFDRAKREQVGLEFDSVMIVAEDSTIKSTLVRLHEDACAKAEVAMEDAEERLPPIVVLPIEPWVQDPSKALPPLAVRSPRVPRRRVRGPRRMVQRRGLSE